MALVDDLILDLLVLISAAVFYTGFLVWLESRRKDPDRTVSLLGEGAARVGLLDGMVGASGCGGSSSCRSPGPTTSVSSIRS